MLKRGIEFHGYGSSLSKNASDYEPEASAIHLYTKIRKSVSDSAPQFFETLLITS